MHYKIRKPTQSDLPALTQLWYEGWQVAHAAHVPASLIAIRTFDSFATRLSAHFGDTRVIGENKALLGFCITKGPEIYQIFVTPEAQGTGAAAALITDGLDRICDQSYTAAKLDVNPNNHRAIAFYAKMGWQQKAVETIMLDTLTDPFPLPCLVMIKNFKQFIIC